MQVQQAIRRGFPVIHRPPLERSEVCAHHGQFTSRCHLGTVWTGCPVCSAEAEAARQAHDARMRGEREHAEWVHRLGRAGIPERFMDRSLDNYRAETAPQRKALAFAKEYAEDFAQVRKTGRGAIFVGNVGTGKTHLAVAIGVQAMRVHGASVLLTTVKRAIRSIKDTWVKGSAQTEGQAVAVLAFPDLLILDEVGVQFDTEFERQAMFDVLNERYERRRPTIFLSNKTQQEVAATLGERVMDRLREDGAVVVPFGWPSHRGRAAL